MLAAETIAGVNRILWRNNSANFLHSWALDSSWGWQSSSGTIDPSPAGAVPSCPTSVSVESPVLHKP